MHNFHGERHRDRGAEPREDPVAEGGNRYSVLSLSRCHRVIRTSSGLLTAGPPLLRLFSRRYRLKIDPLALHERAAPTGS